MGGSTVSSGSGDLRARQQQCYSGMTAALRAGKGGTLTPADEQHARDVCYVNNPPDVRYVEINQ